MAVYTDVALDALETLLSEYDIGGARSFKGIAEGIENSNFYLQTDRGAFILTLYEKRVRESDLPFFLGLMEHLAKRGLNCPLPVRNKNGQVSTHVNGRPAAILTFLDGLSVRRPSAEHCAAAGAALAALHLAGADFPLARENALSLQGWRTLANAVTEKADEIQPGLENLISQTLRAVEDEWPAQLPSGIVHADLFPDNVLFMGEKISGLIDFYFACNDAFAYDLAVMLNSWCFEPDGAYNITNGRRLIAGYRQHRDLNAREIAALPTLARGAALRFLLTRLYDWFNPDPSALVRPKDPREFAKRLRFHQQIRTAAEYGA